jgi:glycosyltransferase involved in cell wall biosynthesis
MLAAGQRDAGVHVAAVLEPGTEIGHPFVKRLESMNVPVTPIIVGGREYIKEFRALRALISELRPDVVHTHGYRSDVIGAAAARRVDSAVVSTVHGFTGGSWRNRVNELVQCLALRRAAAVVAVAAPIVSRLTAAGVPRRKITWIPNGFSSTGGSLSRRAARQRLGLDDSSLVAGWVGRLSHEKGADVVLKALALTPSPWSLSIVGDGGEADHLLRLERDLGLTGRVHWHGEVSNAAAYFAAFDAFVLSSRTEGTPITLFEAMDARIPIIATRVGGVPDVVSTDSAIVVPSEDPKSIAEALRAIASDPAAAARRAEVAHGKLTSSFSDTAWLDRMDAVYRAALEAGRSADVRVISV